MQLFGDPVSFKDHFSWKIYGSFIGSLCFKSKYDQIKIVFKANVTAGSYEHGDTESTTSHNTNTRSSRREERLDSFQASHATGMGCMACVSEHIYSKCLSLFVCVRDR